MKSRSDPRHSARKLALANIFSWLFLEADTEAVTRFSEELLETTEEEKALEETIELGVKTNLEEIDKLIETSAPDWPLDKISKVDLVILRIAIFEIVYGKKTPVKVAVDEAVELAKEFGNDTSPKFINGVLGTVTEGLESKVHE